jgi:hypothetical protein
MGLLLRLIWGEWPQFGCNRLSNGSKWQGCVMTVRTHSVFWLTDSLLCDDCEDTLSVLADSLLCDDCEDTLSVLADRQYVVWWLWGHTQCSGWQTICCVMIVRTHSEFWLTDNLFIEVWFSFSGGSRLLRSLIRKYYKLNWLGSRTFSYFISFTKSVALLISVCQPLC